MEKSLIIRCEEIIRDLTNHIADGVKKKPFREEVIKRLKFSKIEDWDTLCSMMDVLSDTELAKKNFYKYSLGGPTKISDYGEQYLRLYGITNALYLQKTAIISFLELVKLKDKRTLAREIEDLKVLELRHKVGAHTVDFLDHGEKNPHQIARGFLAEGNIATSDSKGNFIYYDLKELTNEFDKVAVDILIKSTEKFIQTVLKNGGKKKDEYIERLQAVRWAQNGDQIIWVDEGKDKFIIRMINVSKSHKY